MPSRITESHTRRLPSPTRDPWRDNARVVLIALVVFGHLLEPLDNSRVIGTLYRFIYLFHIPAFAFLSGSVARAEPDPALLRRTAFRLLLPYLMFQGLYGWAAHLPGWPGAGPDGVATPYWLLWYLLSLSAWRLMLPLFARLRQPLLLAVALALLAGCAPDVGYYLSLSRTLVFFPLFLLGWRYANGWRERVTEPRWQLAAAVTLVTLLAVASLPGIDSRWLYGSLGYDALGADALSGMGWRLLQLVGNAAGTAAVLALIPRQRLRWSGLSPGTLQTFLAHGFLIKIAVAFGAFVWLGNTLPMPVTLALLLGLSVICVLLLSGSRSQRWLSPLVAPRWLEQLAWRGPPGSPSAEDSGGRSRS